MQRITSQRQIILEYLKDTKSHPTAEMVFEEARKILPRISRGTVYRNLKEMTESGEITEIDGSIARYDGDTSRHAHFFCEACGKVHDIYKEITFQVAGLPGKAERSEVRFYGKCNLCKKP